MTTYNEVRLKNLIRDCGSVELTIVDEHDNVSEEKYTSFQDAKHTIQWHENECEVFF